MVVYLTRLTLCFVCSAVHCHKLSDANDRIIKAMNEIQDFVSSVYKSTLKQTSFESCFKKMLTKIRV
jgi:hypothetical protein